MTHPSPENATARLPGLTDDAIVEDYLIAPRSSSDRLSVYASGDVYTFLATSIETDLAFNFFDFFVPPDSGPPAHFHTGENETWYVTDGELQFNLGNLGNNSLVVPEETLIFGPKNRVHGFRNLDSTASIYGVTPGARALSFTNPGNLDLFFEAISPEVTDENQPIPEFNPTEEDFQQIIEYSIRTGAGITFPEAVTPPSDHLLNYVLVLPEDADSQTVTDARALSELDGFEVWTTGDHPGINNRPTFEGDFGIEYTSLLNLTETGNEFEYSQFSLANQTTETTALASLSGSQVVTPTASSATGIADLQLTEAGEIEYSLTVSGVDFGEFIGDGNSQTSDELDDAIAIHVHAGALGNNGPHVFNLLDRDHQQETNFEISLNDDGSVNIEGIWSNTEAEIPSALRDLIDSNGLPGSLSDFYFQIHTEGNPDGEIRGQIGLTSSDFPESTVSEDYEAFYVNEGTLSLHLLWRN